MNIPRPVLVREGILDSERVCALDLPQQLFFRNLLHVCDGADRFDADADDLRLTLYRRSRDRVKIHHVQQWLMDLRAARLVILYTRSGKTFGQVLNYGQRDTKRKVLHPAPDDEAELPLVPSASPPKPQRDKPPPPRLGHSSPPAPPPSDSPKELNGSEVKDTTFLPEAEWLAGLARAYPEVNVRAELTACLVKYPNAGRKFFEGQWLVNWEPPMRRKEDGATAMPEPEGFRTWATNRYGKEPKPWSSFTDSERDYIVRLMKEDRAA